MLCVFILGICVTSLPVGKYLTSKETYLYLLNGILLPIHNLPGVFQDGLYTTVNGALWTMPVEFVSYIGLAIIFWLSTIIGKKEKNKTLQRIFHIAAVVILIIMFALVEVFIQPNGFLGTVIRPMILFFIGSVFWDFAERITLDIRIGAVTLGLFLILSGIGFFNIGVVLLLPYAIFSLMLIPKQIHVKTNIFNISYEMYLVGWPIQQTLFMCSSNNMSPIMNIILTIPLDIILGWIIYKITENSKLFSR